GAHAAGRLTDQPEAVATDMIHMRIDRGDAGRHGQHGLHGIAACGQNVAAVLDRRGMRSTDDAAAMSAGMMFHDAIDHIYPASWYSDFTEMPAQRRDIMSSRMNLK